MMSKASLCPEGMTFINVYIPKTEPRAWNKINKFLGIGNERKSNIKMHMLKIILNKM